MLEELFGLISQNCTSATEPPGTSAAPPTPIKHPRQSPCTKFSSSNSVGEVCHRHEHRSMKPIPTGNRCFMGIFSFELPMQGVGKVPRNKTAAQHQSNHHGQPLCEDPRLSACPRCPETLCVTPDIALEILGAHSEPRRGRLWGGKRRSNPPPSADSGTCTAGTAGAASSATGASAGSTAGDAADFPFFPGIREGLRALPFPSRSRAGWLPSTTELAPLVLW